MAIASILVFSTGMVGGFRELGLAIRNAGLRGKAIVPSQIAAEARDLYLEVYTISNIWSLRKLRYAVERASADGDRSHWICCDDRLGLHFCTLLESIAKDPARAAALRRCYLKHEMRTILRRGNRNETISIPLLGSPEQNEELIEKVPKGKTWILKPAFGSASELVSTPLRGAHSIKNEYHQVVSQSRSFLGRMRWRGVDWSRVFVLEEYIVGREFTVEGIARAGLIDIVGICGKECGLKQEGGVKAEGSNYAPPSTLDLDKRSYTELLREARRGVRAVGLSGVFHMEMKWDESCDRPRIIEINPRLPGGMTVRIHRETVGCNLAAYLLSALCGGPIRTTRRLPKRGVCGDVPLSFEKRAGIYDGYHVATPAPWLPLSSKCTVEIHEAMAAETPVDASLRERYFAYAYLTAPTHREFLSLVRHVRAGVTPLLKLPAARRPRRTTSIDL